MLKQMQKNLNKGFTLIELMIVIAIIGILAAIAIPAYQDYIARSQMAEAMTLTDGMKTAVVEAYSQTGTCPTNGTAGISLASSITGKYVTTVTTAGTGSATGGCTITALMKGAGSVSTGIQGANLVLTMTNNGGSFSWACTSSAASKYLPAACRP